MHDLSNVFTTAGGVERAHQPLTPLVEDARSEMAYSPLGDWYQVHYSCGEGWVRDISLWQGAMLTLCDMDVTRAYQSQHALHDGVYLCLVLEGTLGLAGLEGRRIEISAGEGGMFRAANSLTASPHGLMSWHGVGRLRCISLLIEGEHQQPENIRGRLGAWDAQVTGALVRGTRSFRHTNLHPHPSRWTPGFSVYQQWETKMPSPGSGTAPCDEGCLLEWQGAGLQLLARALHQTQGLRTGSLDATEEHATSCRHLEAVRKRLDTSPQMVHSLSELARLACMSPSSLRQKFRDAYGKSLGHYQRECRMQCAQQALSQGMSIQQVAHRAGYAHACNFATAYRRHFGLSPQEARARCHEIERRQCDR